MKNPIIITLAFIAITFVSCENATVESNNNDAIKELEIKLTATEAQLINVSAELARCKGTDESSEVDSTQLDNNRIDQ
tara:strand:- start:121 stop:354 length:234 start_codon:yes stop_codon:yes gene_type:complete